MRPFVSAAGLLLFFFAAHCGGGDAGAGAAGTADPADTEADAKSGADGGAGTNASSAPARCGDGKVDANEACDDGNTTAGDGCNAKCDTVEKGFGCPKEGAACVKYGPATWMSALPGNTSLTSLDIPGTHESCARHEPISGTAKAQNFSIADQLAAGVRYLDIRCRHYQDHFEIHHGPIYQDMNFDDVLDQVNAFLDKSNGETILMHIKEEYDPSGNTTTFEQVFDSYAAKKPARWYLDTTTPTLDAARNKIVLVRRFPTLKPKGLDATGWRDNTTFTIDGPARFRIQDAYEVGNNDDKWTAITNLFNEETKADPKTLYINYTSGYHPLLFGVPNIGDVANVINPKLVGYYNNRAAKQEHYGVVAMDFIDDVRASAVLEKNFVQP